MKKIALLIGRYTQAGGLEKYARRLAEAFASKGCYVTVLTTEYDDHPFPNIEVIPLTTRSSFTLYQLIHFNSLCKKWLRAHPQDLVFGMERTSEQDVLRAGSGVHRVYLARRKQIEGSLKALSLSLNPLHTILCNYEKDAFEHPALQLLFTNSNMVKKEICTHFTTDPKKIEVVYNGVEYTQFEEAFSQRLFPAKKSYHFLFVGNGYLRKGLALLLPALAQLKEKEWCLSVVGKEKRIDHFKQIAEKLHISQKVQFYGPQKNLIPFYQQADALVIPSLYDPFANVTLEALAFGLFIVTSSFNGASEILTPSLGTVISDIFTIDAITASLQKALHTATDRQSCQYRRLAIKGFDFNHQLDTIVTKTLMLQR
jgi:UDP-glucose:(heptosyl)LPS alpha-1,3-glucosyltransferase